MSFKLWLLVFNSLCSNFCFVNSQYAETPMGFLMVNNMKFYPGGDHIHSFRDHEATNFTCHQLSGVYNTLSFTSQEANSETMVISSNLGARNSPTSLYVVLLPVHDGLQIECRFGIPDGPPVFVHLRLQRTIVLPEPMLRFKVNGVILPLVNNDDITYEFQYPYIDGEQVTVDVLADEQLYSDVTCHINSNKPQTLNLTRNSDTITSFYIGKFTMKMRNDGSILDCSALRILDNMFYHATLTFSYYRPDNDQFIDGLIRAKVWAQYTNDTSHVIKYFANEELLLTCNTWHGPAEFGYDSRTVMTSPGHFRGSRWFQVRPNFNSATVQCPYRFNDVEVTYLTIMTWNKPEEMHTATATTRAKTQAAIPELYSGIIHVKSQAETQATSQITQNAIQATTKATSDPGVGGWWVGAAGSALVLAGCAAFVACAVVCYRKSRDDGNRGSGARAYSSEIERVYETVNYEMTQERVYEEPNAHAVYEPSNHNKMRDISLRAPMPLPAEANKGNKRYIHYDTPYEFRIFRYGVPSERRAVS